MHIDWDNTKKKDLVDMCKSYGIKVKSSDTKAVLVPKIKRAVQCAKRTNLQLSQIRFKRAQVKEVPVFLKIFKHKMNAYTRVHFILGLWG